MQKFHRNGKKSIPDRILDDPWSRIGPGYCVSEKGSFDNLSYFWGSEFWPSIVLDWVNCLLCKIVRRFLLKSFLWSDTEISDSDIQNRRFGILESPYWFWDISRNHHKPKKVTQNHQKSVLWLFVISEGLWENTLQVGPIDFEVPPSKLGVKSRSFGFWYRSWSWNWSLVVVLGVRGCQNRGFGTFGTLRLETKTYQVFETLPELISPE